MSIGNFYSPGKLLITSEYFVLDGAVALAVPTKLGQELHYEEIEDTKQNIIWNTYIEGKLWFSLEMNYSNWEIINTNDSQKAKFIIEVLKTVQKLSENVLQNTHSYNLSFNIEFPADFGLGSSSTMINNLADWANIDAFQLNETALGGSGYDIAIAKEKSAILYQNNPRKIQKIEFNPPFKDELVFIHLNQKQDSREGINLYRSKKASEELIQQFSDLTMEILKSDSIEDFSELMNLHEAKIAEYLGIQPVKEKLFKDYPGFVKSLGAWGGDFVLASKFGDFKKYFFNRNYKKIYDWKDLII